MSRFLLFTFFCLLNTINSPDLQAQSTRMTATPMPSPMTTLSVRLRPGQDLKTELDKLVTQHRIEAGLVLTCVGSLTDVSLRLANQEGATAYHGHFEIVALVGTLSTNGSHLHLAVSDSTGRTIGGHLMAGNTIYTTAEIVLGMLPGVRYVREPDPTFGYRELVVKKKP
ncbi:PPC domain-containing DNA-binding protein [Fibrella sp. WM1]|uniref:PPC domain-containing DNA-binding protein n=1 Tax=Fibrella musci TaxID=3242485 RepID=UPI003520DD92